MFLVVSSNLGKVALFTETDQGLYLIVNHSMEATSINISFLPLPAKGIFAGSHISLEYLQ